MADQRRQYTGAWIHPISAVLVIVLDSFWTPVEGGAIASIVGLVTLPILIGILAVITFIGVFLIQRFTANDTVSSALAKAFAMSVIAAIPIPVISGTVVGSIFLGWAGISVLQKALPRLSRSNDK